MFFVNLHFAHATETPHVIQENCSPLSFTITGGAARRIAATDSDAAPKTWRILTPLL